MTTTRDRLLGAAQELQASKEKSLIALVDAFEAAEVARDRLAEAEQEQETRRKAALKAGWSEDELTRIGFTDVAAGRPARKTRAKKTANNSASSTTRAASTPAAPVAEATT